MINENEILEKYQKGELEKMSWEEFLSLCNASHYFWNSYPKNVLQEGRNFLLVRVDLSDDPDISFGDNWEFSFWEEKEVIVDWGVPVIITDFQESTAPYAYIILQKTEKGYVPVSGELLPTLEKAEKELQEILQEEQD